MEKLFQLLHELIEHATPHGNARGELHALADAAMADLGGAPAPRDEAETPAPGPDAQGA